MKHAILMLSLAVLLSSCAARQACVNIPVSKKPDLAKQGFVLSLEQDKKLCELGQTAKQKAKGVCGDTYDVMADRETTLKADGQRSRDLIKKISCERKPD